MNDSNANELMNRARKAGLRWEGLKVSRRCAILAKLRRTIALHCESIARIIAHESAKPTLDALSGDVLVALEQLRYYERNAARILRSQRVGKPSFFFRGTRFESRLEAHGVVLIFGASNYPFQLSVVPLVTALVAGNAVVLKCSERTPETANLIVRLCKAADLPQDLVQVLHDGPEQSSALIDARPDFIFFTGSSSHGHDVSVRAAKHLIPTALELGGKDASLVFADCHVARAVEGIAYGAFSNAGRVCVAVKRTYVEAPLYETFIKLLKERVGKLRVDHGPNVDFSPLPDDARLQLRSDVQDALSRGARLHWISDRAADQPMILTDVPANARILTDESFGPVLCVAPFTDEAEAITLANTSPFALSSSVWTSDPVRGRRIAAKLSAGSCAVNDVVRVIANPYASFGGNRASGYGRYHGPEGLRTFSRTKTIMLSSDRREREINWFPLEDKTERQLASLLRFRHGQAGLRDRLSLAFLPVLISTVTFITFAVQSLGKTRLCASNINLPPHLHSEFAQPVSFSHARFSSDINRALSYGCLPIPANTQQLDIGAQPRPGTYAVCDYEDLDEYHKLVHSLFGTPRTLVGASKNSRAGLGPSRFDECAFVAALRPRSSTSAG